MSVRVENKCISVGIDLCRDYSQMTYCMGNMREPESVSVIPGEQKYLIPTIVGKTEAQWCIGDDALLREKNGEAVITGDILVTLLTEKRINLLDEEYNGHQLLKVYFEGLFELLKNNYHITAPDKVMVTVEYPDRILVNEIREIFIEMGYGRDDVKVIGHSESLIYYTIFQKRELWVNDVMVFDFTDNQFMVRRLATMRARTPQPIVVEEIDLSSRIKAENLLTEQGRVNTDSEFLEIAKEYCGKHIVSTVYLTGSGFYEKWMEKSLDYLCSKRRVFQGANLFVKGAGYGNLSLMGLGNAEEYQFVCSGRTLVNIELMIEKDDKNVPVVLSKAGTNWYEAGARAEGILDDTREIKLIISSSLSKKSEELVIDLRGFPPRPNKTTRIEIVLAYKNDSQCVVVVRDLGFGDFFKSSGEKVRTVIEIEDYL